MKRHLTLSLLLLAVVQFPALKAGAAGISVDAGLTPAEDRWIFRTQLRYMQRNDDPGPMDREMERYIWNNVLAYGLRRNLTLMVRQPFIRQEMSMSGMSGNDSGSGDFMVAAKFGVYRKNTADYTIGAAATLGLELPTGDAVFGSDTWDLKPGVYVSWRTRSWASDLSIAYLWNGFADENGLGVDPGDELSLDWAVARQFSLGSGAEISLAPVMELSYLHVSPDRIHGADLPNSGESVLFLSPGLKFTVSSFIWEALVQIPVWQDSRGLQTKRDTGFILGIRYMF